METKGRDEMTTKELKAGDFVEIASNYTPKPRGYITALLGDGLAEVRQNDRYGTTTHRKLSNLTLVH